jgi:dynamin 1-like protein
MTPTLKLVSDMVSMQTCYINTTHPDFIGGHQATALITDKLNAAKGPPPPTDPKRAINNNKDLDVDLKKDEGFFSSFFSKGQPKKKGAAAMEAPPPVIRPQGALSDREVMETEVISAYLF